MIEERDGILMQYGKISASCHELEDLKHERNYLMDRLSLDGKNSESLQVCRTSAFLFDLCNLCNL